MITKIQVRRDTAANWIAVNPTLSSGEIGLETDTGKFKMGNGTSTWVEITEYFDRDVVHKTGDESIDGVKTFLDSPIIPAPTTDLQAATKKYVDDNAVVGSSRGSLFCDATKLQHIDVGGFYRPNVQYSHFFWEFTVKPFISPG